MKIIISTILLTVLILPTYSNAASSIKRYALVIGKNFGGSERPTLKYAVTDAMTVSKVFEQYGGITHANNYMLLDPSKSEVNSKLAILKKSLADDRKNDIRNELIIYYSGHSDEEGLLIGKEKLQYLSLKKAVTELKADVSVVILDSCASGSLTALKGGKKRAPFLSNNMSKLKGHVFLTSSSSDEAAQESDKIKASFFTHYLVSGLRGAADKSGDGQVTINEAYKYAYNETLAKTSKTMNGPQHPSYNMQLAGTGELVLTDIRETSAKVIFPEGMGGRLYLRDGDGNLVAEVNKVSNRPVSIGVMPGLYTVVLNNKEGVFDAEVTLKQDKTVQVGQSSFKVSKREQTVSRGNESYVKVPFDLTLVPSKSTYFYEEEKATIHNFSLALGYSQFEKLEGVAFALGGSIVEEHAKGAQFSFGFNKVRGNMKGAQYSYGANMVQHELQGAQFAIGLNQVRDKSRAAQFSVGANIADSDFQGAQFTVGYNSIKGDAKAAQFSVGVNSVEKNLEGAQLSVFSNYSDSITRGFQATVFSNIVSNDIDGGQLSVFNNYTGANLSGVQASVFSNYVKDEIKGLQLGFFNYAKSVKGVQLGLINYANDVEGISIAPITIVKNGTYRVQLTQDAMNFTTLGIKMGTKHTYSMLGYGRTTDSGNPFQKYHFAFGGYIPAVGKLKINPEIGTSIIREAGGLDLNRDNHLSMSNFKLNAVYDLFDHLSIFGGGSYNYITDLDSNFTSTFNDRRGDSSPSWIGWQAGLEASF